MFCLERFLLFLIQLEENELSYKTQSTNKILLQYFQNLKIIMSKITAWLLEIIHRRWTVAHGKKSFLSLFQITPNHRSGKNMHPQHEWHNDIGTLNLHPLVILQLLEANQWNSVCPGQTEDSWHPKWAATHQKTALIVSWIRPKCIAKTV